MMQDFRVGFNPFIILPSVQSIFSGGKVLDVAQQHLQLQGGCDVDYEMILDTSTNSLVLSRLRKEGHVLSPHHLREI